jgi:hypothetical protein
MPCSGMAVMEAESILTRKTRFVRAQNIVYKELILVVIMTYRFCKLHPREKNQLEIYVHSTGSGLNTIDSHKVL